MSPNLNLIAACLEVTFIAEIIVVIAITNALSGKERVLNPTNKSIKYPIAVQNTQYRST